MLQENQSTACHSQVIHFGCLSVCMVLILNEQVEATFLIVKFKNDQKIVLVLKVGDHFIIEAHNQPED